MREVSRLNLLLTSKEKEIPELVLRTYRFLNSLDIWFQISRNAAAYSCHDAAKKRLRGGKIGIPVYDEMKSLFCGCLDGNAQFIYLFTHCRADRRVNFRSVQRLLEARSRPQMLSREPA
jgi:hypothetical protein